MVSAFGQLGDASALACASTTSREHRYPSIPFTVSWLAPPRGATRLLTLAGAYLPHGLGNHNRDEAAEGLYALLTACHEAHHAGAPLRKEDEATLRNAARNLVAAEVCPVWKTRCAISFLRSISVLLARWTLLRVRLGRERKLSQRRSNMQTCLQCV